jgi:hypothetical protein
MFASYSKEKNKVTQYVFHRAVKTKRLKGHALSRSPLYFHNENLLASYAPTLS